MAKFSIVIPVKNQYTFVKMCLNSIVKNYPDQEVVLVDDGSTEETTIEIMKSYSEKFNWLYFRNETSIGHTGACNIGLKNTTAENVFLVNSDTILPENSLMILSDALDENEDIAVVGPSTSSASGEQLISGLYNRRFAMSAEVIEEYAKEHSKEIEIKEISLVNGFCFGMKRSVFEKVGGFDHALTCYGNEKELLVRIRKEGYKVVWVKGSYVHHFGKMSYSQESINIGQAQIDADRYIIKKHGSLK